MNITFTDEASFETALDDVKANLLKRPFTVVEKAILAEKLANMTVGGDRKSDQNISLNLSSVSIKDAAKQMSVSPRSIKSVRNLRNKHPETYEKLNNGKFKSINAAVQESKNFDYENMECVYVYRMESAINGEILEPSICKIGYTTSGASKRIMESQSATAVGYVLKIELIYYTKNANNLEKKLHNLLAIDRVPNICSKEWFKVSVNEVEKSIKYIEEGEGNELGRLSRCNNV